MTGSAKIAAAAAAIICAWPWMVAAQSTATGPKAEIQAFNEALADATRRIDNKAALALWDDDGVSLLPSTPPIVGKAAIARFLDDVTAHMPGAHMRQFDMECFDIDVAGNWASEWCREHQIVEFSDGSPTFDGKGHMLLVLHRNKSGKWQIRREMWNQAPVPK
jgi:ketosteroid isomerase-like protein